MSSSTERPIAPRNLPYYTQSQLDQFIDAHERFLTNQPRSKRALLRFLQADGMHLSGRRLCEADFTGANFRGARMVRTDFERAYLFCADLSRSDAREANFRRADMREAVLAVSSADGDLQIANGGGEARSGAPATYSVDFTNCSMKKAKLRSAKLKGANFAGALLEGADLEGANLTGANFHGAVLIGARLDRVTIDKDALKDCIVDPSAAALDRVHELRRRLEAAEAWIRSNGQTGAAAKLDDEDLRPLEASFEGRRLTALSAHRACAIGVSFAGAQLQAARFEGADLRCADFSGADLRGASFKGANLHHAKFDDANLKGLPLGGERVANVDFSEAKYSAAALAKAIC